jgi:hypothetical protein
LRAVNIPKTIRRSNELKAMTKTAAGRELLTGALVAGATAAASALAGNSANTRKSKKAEGAHATGETEGVDAVPQDVIATVAR